MADIFKGSIVGMIMIWDVLLEITNVYVHVVVYLPQLILFISLDMELGHGPSVLPHIIGYCNLPYYCYIPC